MPLHPWRGPVLRVPGGLLPGAGGPVWERLAAAAKETLLWGAASLTFLAHPAAPRACSLLAPLGPRRNPGCWKLPQARHCLRGVARKSRECRECWLLQTSRVSQLQEQAPHSLTASYLAAGCLVPGSPAGERLALWP